MKTTQIVDAVIELYPNLAKDKNKIMRHVYKSKDFDKIEMPLRETCDILEKFNYDNYYYYKDLNGSIIDTNVNVVGVYEIDSHGNIDYYFFKKIKEKIEKIKNTI